LSLTFDFGTFLSFARLSRSRVDLTVLLPPSKGSAELEEARLKGSF